MREMILCIYFTIKLSTFQGVICDFREIFIKKRTFVEVRFFYMSTPIILISYIRL